VEPNLPPEPIRLPARNLTRRQEASLVPRAPDLDWQTFLALFRREFRQGQHVTILGPTQSGKTTLGLEVLDCRDYVLFLATKRKDPLIAGLASRGYRISNQLDIRARDGQILDPKFVFWPVQTEISKGKRMDMRQFKVYQEREVRRALNYVWHSMGWAVYADETIWLADDLKLRDELETLWFQGATAKISLIASAQRPAWVPRGAYSSPEHLFFFHTSDKEDLDRLADIGAGINRMVLSEEITSLKRHEFLYLQPRSQPPLRIRSKVELGGR